MTGSVWANVYIGGGGTSSNDGGRTKVSTVLEDIVEAYNDNDEARLMKRKAQKECRMSAEATKDKFNRPQGPPTRSVGLEGP